MRPHNGVTCRYKRRFTGDLMSPATLTGLISSLCRLPESFRPILSKNGFSKQIFVQVTSIKLNGNSSIGSRADTCGQTDGQTDMT